MTGLFRNIRKGGVTGTRGQRIAIAAILLFGILFGFWYVGQWSRDSATQRPSAQAPLTVTPGPRTAPTPRLALATEPAATQPGVVGVFVEPDDGRAPILAELNAARRSIDLEIYLLSDEEILQALERAQARGVTVRVIMEEHPFGGAGGEEQVFARMEEAGIAVRWSNPAFRLSHIKTFVIDAEVAIIMNQNLTKTSFSGNREFGAITTRPKEVAQAAAIFEADWRRRAEPPDGPLVVSPTTSRRTLLNLIEGATTSIDIYAEVVRDEEIVASLEQAASSGVAVRLIVSNDSEENDRGREERARLAVEGVEVRIARGLYIHAKMVLVDGNRAFVGSQNFTTASLDLNRELGILLDDPTNIARLTRTFNADFSAGREE